MAVLIKATCCSYCSAASANRYPTADCGRIENAEQSGAYVWAVMPFRFAGGGRLSAAAACSWKAWSTGSPSPRYRSIKASPCRRPGYCWIRCNLQTAAMSWWRRWKLSTARRRNHVKFIVKNWEELVDDLQPPISSMFFGAVSATKPSGVHPVGQYVGDDPQVFAVITNGWPPARNKKSTPYGRCLSYGGLRPSFSVRTTIDDVLL